MLFLLAIACKEVFEVPPQSRAGVGLYYLNDANTGTPLISVHGLGHDSMWYDGINTGSFYLPFSETGTSTFVLLIDSVADTLQIEYKPRIAYASMESGFYYTYWIDKVMSTGHKIERINLTDTIVNSEWHENIQLYINDSTAFTSSN